MTLELVSVDGQGGDALSPCEGTALKALAGRIDGVDAQLRALCDGQARVMQAVLAQQAEIARLNRALAMMRVTRTQEAALCAAIRARAKLLAAREGLRGAENSIAAAIRATLRETTGARAMGDVQASQYEAAMRVIASWDMAGALRRIRKAREEKKA